MFPLLEIVMPIAQKVDRNTHGSGSCPDGSKYLWAEFGPYRVVYYPDGGGSQAYLSNPTHGWVVDVNDDMPHEIWASLLMECGAPTC